MKSCIFRITIIAVFFLTACGSGIQKTEFRSPKKIAAPRPARTMAQLCAEKIAVLEASIHPNRINTMVRRMTLGGGAKYGRGGIGRAAVEAEQWADDKRRSVRNEILNVKIKCAEFETRG